MLVIGLFLGLIAGAVAGALFDPGAWLYGAAIGGATGGLLQQLRQLRAQVSILQSRLDAVQDSLPTAVRPAPAGVRAAQPTVEPPAAPVAASAPYLPPQALDVPVYAPLSSAPAPTPMRAAPADPFPPTAPLSADIGRAAAPGSGPARRARDPAMAAPPLPLLGWLLGGNTVVRAGVVILFFGVAFLLKFAYEHSHLPVEARLIGVTAAAIALLTIGWRLRQTRAGYALTLQGGGVALLSLTIFAAYRLYAVLPAGPAFALLVVVAALSAVLAILQDSLALALLGVSGGFLAPVLASTGHGSHVMLFSYYLVLNLGIVAVAWKKAWRALNLAGFAYTFVIGLIWGARYYQPEFLATTEPFLIGFFLLYVALPLLFARRQRDRLAPYVDATLVFGAPIAAFSLQAALVRDIPLGLAWSALVVGVLYLTLATLLWRRMGEPLRLLIESFLALGGGFATLCIPLAFDGRVTSALWAVEGAAVVWVGLRQNRPWPRAAGYLLQIAAGVAFARASGFAPPGLPFLNSEYLGCALIALAAGFCSAAICRAQQDTRGATLLRGETAVAGALLLWAAAWWAAGGVRDIDAHSGAAYLVHLSLMYLTLSAAAVTLLARPLRWSMARAAGYGVLPVMVLALLADLLQVSHPSVYLGWLAWPLALTLHLLILRRVDGQDPRIERILHPAGVWLLALLLTMEISWQVARAVAAAPAWAIASQGLVMVALLWLLDAETVQRRWPVAGHPQSYRKVAAGVLAAALVLWTLWASLSSDGAAAPLPYVLLFNPLDIALALALFTLVHIRQRATSGGGTGLSATARQASLVVVAGAAFVCANGALLRAVHHAMSVPYALPDLWSSVVVQAALALFWSLGALVLMALGTRRGLRTLWLTGAALMAAVVVKLFLVDLSNVGGIERIVSFIGAGALMLVIGYIAPVPPRRVAAPAAPAGETSS